MRKNISLETKVSFSLMKRIFSAACALSRKVSDDEIENANRFIIYSFLLFFLFVCIIPEILISKQLLGA